MGKSINNLIHFIFIIVQLLLYITFIVLDLSGGKADLSNAIKFTTIFLCFCYVLPSQSHNRSISYSLKAAMLFTLISDLFILLLDYYLYGVLTFIVVQLLYNYRISVHNTLHIYNSAKNAGDKALSKDVSSEIVDGKAFSDIGDKAISVLTSKIFISRLIIQLIISACICFLLVFLGVKLVPLLIAASVYFTGLLINTARALAAAKKESGDISMKLFAAGLLLFLLCDINVGLFNLSSFIKLPQDIYFILYNISSVLMWFFYAPSQTLIALSADMTKKGYFCLHRMGKPGKERNKII